MTDSFSTSAKPNSSRNSIGRMTSRQPVSAASRAPAMLVKRRPADFFLGGGEHGLRERIAGFPDASTPTARRSLHVVDCERRRVKAVHEEHSLGQLELVADLTADFDRFVDRQLFRHGHDRHRRRRVIREQAPHSLGLAVDEPGRERLDGCFRHAQILKRMARRWAVDDHQIPAAAIDLVPDLADRHQLLEARRRSDEVLIDLAVEDRAQHAPNRHDHVQVFLERGLAVDVLAKQPRDRLDRLVARRLAKPRDRSTAIVEVEADEQHPFAASHGRERESRGDRGLADPALARDEDEPTVEERAGAGHRPSAISPA